MTFDDLSKTEATAHSAAFVASLGPRLESFLDDLEARGGPMRGELDLSAESLDALEAWVISQEADVGASRVGAIDLPLWVDLDPSTRDWGPQLLRLTDGVIAYWAAAYTAKWPNTEWTLHDGPRSDVDYRQPMLWIDGGRGRINVRRIVRNCIDGLVVARDERAGLFRRVWEAWAPKD